MKRETEERKAEAKAWAVATRLKAHSATGQTRKFQGGSYTYNQDGAAGSQYAQKKIAKQDKKEQSKGDCNPVTPVKDPSPNNGGGGAALRKKNKVHGLFPPPTHA